MALDKLEAALQQNAPASGPTVSPDAHDQPTEPQSNGTELNAMGPSPHSRYAAPIPQPTKAGGVSAAPNEASNAHNRQTSLQPKYFAVCVPTGGIYKILNEIDVSEIKADANLFLGVEQIYQSSRRFKTRWKRILLRPVNIEFIQVCSTILRDRLKFSQNDRTLAPCFGN